jgi:hypothetical protein
MKETMPITPLRDNERGIALVLSLILVMTMSVMAASLMFLSQTETFASLNYRLMSQARYGAESGVHKTVNHLLNSYVPPATGGADPIAAYDTTKSPVQFNGAPVILSADAAVASNYPVAAAQTAFNAAGQGTLVAGNGNVGYKAYATMLSMQQVNGNQTVIAWQITANGTITTTHTTTVEVTSILEKQLTPQVSAVYGSFATGATCGALKFSDGSVVDSYDSTSPLGVGGKPVTTASGGNVGTNGNMSGTGPTTVNGTLSTPRVGVGSCSSGNVTPLSASGGAVVTGGVVHLSQDVVVPDPPLPNPLPPLTPNAVGATCAASGSPANCTASAGGITLNPAGATMSLGNLSVGAGAVLHLTAGTYNINSVAMTGGTLIIDSGPVILNVAGQSQATPINFSGGDIQNMTFDPRMFQLQYAGTGNIILRAGASSGMGAVPNAQQLLAPNAAVTFSQGGDYYGSIVSKTLADTGIGGLKLHFDRHLSAAAPTTFVVGTDMLTAFSWKKY